MPNSAGQQRALGGRLCTALPKIPQLLYKGLLKLAEVWALRAQQLCQLAGDATEFSALLLFHRVERLFDMVVANIGGETPGPDALKSQSPIDRVRGVAHVLLVVAEDLLQGLLQNSGVGCIASLDDCLADTPQLGLVGKGRLGYEPCLCSICEQPAIVQELGSVVHAIFDRQKEADLLEHKLKRAATAAKVCNLQGTLLGSHWRLACQHRNLPHSGLEATMPELGRRHEAPHHLQEDGV
mmetsp:Transcript_126824/g.370785  ORF Transcript_126824/g.370785 Transcript_126824/m.370785 type:complete len:239 (+) Transcript_126824:156-872(+)